ncbi:DNA cytosine methyltransferase [Thioalkalivibrio sp. HL-Eb18]|uniref:DNA cytosine methyltransferase n=1 Tax=Thioalkalivibrio sp. HL-Eb18 TaxID=1266913 RepID=UPI002101536F|nr:DNA cytosine methyltransferase [Thioalkalivibrio sp. HL-Eb18]
MARAGLGPDWTCLFANDFDHKKCATYRRNWGDGEIVACDVRQVTPETLPGKANLIWGSFPCQDLSLAGAGAGLKGDRSGTFWPFWDVISGLIAGDRAPEIIALENVVGTLHSHGGRDFEAICSAFQRHGYQFGAMVIDAALFLPHSRPRLFIIGIRQDVRIPDAVVQQGPSTLWHSKTLQNAIGRLPSDLRQDWVWWNMPTPPPRTASFADLIEDDPQSVTWHSREQTQQLIAMMTETNLEKLEGARNRSRAGERVVGAVYKRTRRHSNGSKVQRAEVRFDDVAGCLRTPSGGSSRQLIIVVDDGRVRSRLISSRETARLMGLSDDYQLPENYNEAYHLSGDGVAVPAVRHIASNIFSPILHLNPREGRVAA